MHFVEHLFGRQLELYTRSFLTKDRSHAVFIFIIIACECSPQDWNNNGDDFWNAVLVCGQVRFDLFLRQLKRQSSSMEVPFPMINLWRGKRKMWRVSNNFYHIFKIMLKLKELFFFFFFFSCLQNSCSHCKNPNVGWGCSLVAQYVLSMCEGTGFGP